MDNKSIWATLYAILGAVFLTGFAFNGWCGEKSGEDKPTDYMIVVTGSEILRGIYEDKHVPFLTQTLEPLGCCCQGALCVGDRRSDLLDALHYASERANLIIVTGGLGPTDADITRKTLTEFTGIELREHPEVMKAMMRRFNVESRDQIRENMQRQTLSPVRGTYLNNPNGTAVGLVFDDGHRVVVSLPGPPRELQPMVNNELIPFLAQRFGIHSIGSSVTMRFVGIGESNIDHAMHQNMKLPEDIIISSRFELGRVDYTFSLPGNTPQDRERLKGLEKELLQYVGDYLYADDDSSLEDCIIRELRERKSSLVTVETGSGGSIAASLNHAQDATQVYSGGFVAPSDRVMAAMLDIDYISSNSDLFLRSQQTEKAARRACERTNSQWSIAVSEEIRDASNTPFVWIAVGSLQEGFEMKRIGVRGHGEVAHAHLVNGALDLLRRKLRTPQ